MECLLFAFGGIVVGFALGWYIKPSTPANDDPTGEIKQGIMDKLDNAISDIKSTV